MSTRIYLTFDFIDVILKNMKEKETDAHASWLPYMAKTENYNRWIFSQYKNYLGNSILDIGAGIGTFAEFIKRKKKITLLEISDDAIKKLKNKFKGLRNIKVIKGDLSKSASIKEMLKRKIDTVICLNTLEHVKNDIAMIRNIRKCLKLKGKLILYVPALKALFGTLDINVGHYRRYQKKEIEAALKKNRFCILKSKYVNSAGVLSWFLYSRILKRDKVKEKRILFYDKIFIPILSTLENIFPPPAGQSLLIIAEAV